MTVVLEKREFCEGIFGGIEVRGVGTIGIERRLHKQGKKASAERVSRRRLTAARAVESSMMPHAASDVLCSWLGSRVRVEP